MLVMGVAVWLLDLLFISGFQLVFNGLLIAHPIADLHVDGFHSQGGHFLFAQGHRLAG